MKSFLGHKISENFRGVLYICEYNFQNKTILVVREMFFTSAMDALNTYSNIPNPESQLALGDSYEQLCEELNQLHDNLNNPEWVKELAGYL